MNRTARSAARVSILGAGTIIIFILKLRSAASSEFIDHGDACYFGCVSVELYVSHPLLRNAKDGAPGKSDLRSVDRNSRPVCARDRWAEIVDSFFSARLAVEPAAAEARALQAFYDVGAATENIPEQLGLIIFDHHQNRAFV